MIATLLLAASVAAAPSESKLGVRVVGPDDTGVLAASPCPRVAVFAVPSNGSAGAQITAYQGCTGGTSIAQITGQDGLAVNALVADRVVPGWLANSVPQGAKAVEGPASVIGSAGDIAAFWAEFAVLVRTAGFTPVVPATATSFCPIVEALRASGGTFWWSWRARSPMTQGTDELATTLGYRAVLAGCPSLTGVPLVVSDIAPASGPWLTSDDAWLRWFDARLAEDAFAQGAALASAGDGTLAPVKDALLAQLANPSFPDGGTADAGADGGSGAGGGGTVTPHPGTDGELVPVKTKGCSSGASGSAILGILPLLLALRRWRRERASR